MIKVFIISLSLIFALAGCANKDELVEVSYKTLETSAIAYDMVMSSAVDLHDRGVITDDVMDDIKQDALIYFDAYHTAVDALLAYMHASSPTDEDRYKLQTVVVDLGNDLKRLLDRASSAGIEVTVHE